VVKLFSKVHSFFLSTSIIQEQLWMKPCLIFSTKYASLITIICAHTSKLDVSNFISSFTSPSCKEVHIYVAWKTEKTKKTNMAIMPWFVSPVHPNWILAYPYILPYRILPANLAREYNPTNGTAYQEPIIWSQMTIGGYSFCLLYSTRPARRWCCNETQTHQALMIYWHRSWAPIRWMQWEIFIHLSPMQWE
jgi:hypothetical protein